MSLTPSFNRPKPATTTTKNTSFSAAVAETGGNFVVDIISTVTKDDTATVQKTAFRIVVPLVFLNDTLTVDPQVYSFFGNAATYSVGGTTPSLSVATKNKTINFNSFLTAAGDTAENA
ncbi:hypothetical protein [Scytonema sp. NUACC26]|uniref:hypothetical protein n=1 Tax=Scytonema sp. NUACC26 TaxID=3140176 RepID=UPI0034DC3275